MTIPTARAALLAGLALLFGVGLAPAQEGPDGPDGGPAPALTYRTSGEAAAHLRRLEARWREAGVPAEIVRYGESTRGRPLLGLRVGGGKAVVLVHGGLGARDAAGTAACLALADEVGRDESGVSWLLVPAPNPDALDAFLASGFFAGGHDVDRDRDGRAGEDGPDDLDGDGEVLRMRRLARDGAWAPRAPVPGREAPARGMDEAGVDARRDVSYEVLDEGGDDDGDGLVNEDPPGVDLVQGLVGVWDDRAPWRGDGSFPACAAEARALLELSLAETGLVAWLGFSSSGPWVLRASEQGKADELDQDLYARAAGALRAAGARDVKAARDVLGARRNPGSDLDWAGTHLGVPAFRVPVWWIEKEAGDDRARDVADETDWLRWNDRVLAGEGFRAWRPFRHPVLGPVEIGGWRRFTREEPPATELETSARRAAKIALALGPFHPRLEPVVRVEDRGGGLFEVVVHAANRGAAPTDTVASTKQHRDVGVRATLATGPAVQVVAGPRVADLGRLEAGGVSAPVRWLVRRDGPGRIGVVTLRHPKSELAIQNVEAP